MSTKQIKVSDNLSLPQDVVTMATAALGIRGSGKTNTGVVIVEGLLDAGHQVIIIDPLDVWFGLKSSADGREEGYPITVLGGNHGDLPLAEGDGRTVADFLIENQVPAILSLRRLSKSAQRRFVADFAEHFYHRKGEPGKNTPVLCVIDEASLFVPQHFTGDSARMVGAIESWVRQGRVAGIGAMLIDQRAASVNKDVLSQVELMIAHRHTSPQDRKALQVWVQAHATADQEREFMASLASLGKGEAWFWSPEWLKLFRRVQVRMRSTFDSSATPHGGKPVETPKKIAQVELTKLREKLAATIEKAKADDPKELRKQIQELKQQLTKRPTEQVEKIVEKEVPVLKNGQLDRTEKIAGRLEQFGEKLRGEGQRYLDEAAELRKLIAPAAAPRPAIKQAALVRSAAAISRPAPSPVVARKRTENITENITTDLGTGERAILIASAQHQEGVTREQLTVLTGYKRSSRDTYLQRLRSRGYVDQRGETILATDDGIAALGDSFEPLPTGEALQQYWLNRLQGGEQAILRILIEQYPNAVPRDAISDATEYKRSSRDTYLQRLSARKLVESIGRGEVKASDQLF